MKATALLSFLILTLTAGLSQARVYKDVRVGSYDSSIDLADYKGQPFIQFMIDVAYDEFLNESENRTKGKHIKGIRQGEGVEIRLTDDVSTYHVKYKAHWEEEAERGGRSFSAVGTGRKIEYVADASYKHYLRTLEPLVRGEEDEVAKFYSAILSVVANSDPSGIEELSTESKQVAADFVAIYIAEQYRRLTATEGQALGRQHRWDDAVMQVTLLAAFHGGQDRDHRKMFYEGEFTDEVYNQNACLYRASMSDPKRSKERKRKMRLYDYWQFTVRSECPGRSGVNLTRKDFQKMGRAISAEQNKIDGNVIQVFGISPRSQRNFFKTTTEKLMFDQEFGIFDIRSRELVNNIVNYLIQVRRNANLITDSLSN